MVDVSRSPGGATHGCQAHPPDAVRPPPGRASHDHSQTFHRVIGSAPQREDGCGEASSNAAARPEHYRLSTTSKTFVFAPPAAS